MGKSEEKVRLFAAIEGTVRTIVGEPRSNSEDLTRREQQHREGDGGTDKPAEGDN